MSSRYALPLIVASIAAVSSASGSVYITDFGAPSIYNAPGQELNGLVDNGSIWAQNAPNSDPTSPSAWVGTIDYGSSSYKGAAVGGYYDVPPIDPFYAARPIGTALAGATVSLDFSILDSTVAFQSRNDFSITVANGSGANLLSLRLSSTSQIGDYDQTLYPTDPVTSNSVWNISWTSAFASGVVDFGSVGEDATYRLSLDFIANGSDVDFNMAVVGSTNVFTQSGTLIGTAAESFSELRVGFALNDPALGGPFDKPGGPAADYGDNFIVVRGVPEPSALLLLGLSTLGFIRRRR